MLKNLTIRNFKSIREMNLSLRRVNIFIGPPGSGKSNLLEAMKLVSSMPDEVKYLKDLIRLQDMGNLFFDQNLEEKIEIGINETETNIEFENNQFKHRFSQVGDEEKRFSRSYSFDSSRNGNAGEFLFEDLLAIHYYEYRDGISIKNTPSDCLDFPYGENLLWFLINKKGIRDLAKAFLKGFDLRLSIRPVERAIGFSKLIDEDIIIEYPYALLSDTVRRILFYIVAIETNRNASILLEEPEAHAFPYYAKYLGERIGLDDSNQFMITTHNPYLLDAIMEKCKKEDLQIFSVKMENHETMFHPFTGADMELAFEEGPDLFMNLKSLDG